MRRSAILLSVLLLAAMLAGPVLASVDDQYTTALLHFDGENNSTTIIDGSGKTWGAYGNAKISTDLYKFGGSSLYMDGTEDWVSTVSSTDFGPGSGNFTVDFWVYPLDTGIHQVFLDARPSCTAVPYVAKRLESDKFGTYVGGTTYEYGAIAQNQWSHIAWTKSGSTSYMFVNGDMVYSYYVGDFTYSNPLEIGHNTSICGGGYGFHGYVDEFRFSKGIARWTDDFTPPTSAYGETYSTPTPTETPTLTYTPTATETPTLTPTASDTPTPSNTPTITNTPIPAIVWAVSGWELTPPDAVDAIEVLLLADPPDDAETLIYAITYIQASGDDDLVSLVNLVDVESPYEDWDAETNGIWWGTVLVVEDVGDYTAEYWGIDTGPTPTGTIMLGYGGGGNIPFPFKSGTKALYGIRGVHECNAADNCAVDFVGGDNFTGSMPSDVYAVSSGNIISVCEDDNNVWVLVDGVGGRYGYWHLALGNINLYNGAPVQAGQVIGQLARGDFGSGTDNGGRGACTSDGGAIDCSCGWANNGSQANYHLHFRFDFDSEGYFQFANCILHQDTQNFICGTKTYAVGSWIPNGSYSPGPQPTTAPGQTPIPNPDPIQVLGGSHIWDGILSGLANLILNINIFPEHATIGIATYVNNIMQYFGDVFKIFRDLGFFNCVPPLLIASLILTEKIVVLVVAVWRWLLRVIPAAS